MLFLSSRSSINNKLLKQGYVKGHLKLSLRKIYGRYGDLIKQNEITLSLMLYSNLEHDHMQLHSPLINTDWYYCVEVPFCITLVSYKNHFPGHGLLYSKINSSRSENTVIVLNYRESFMHSVLGLLRIKL